MHIPIHIHSVYFQLIGQPGNPEGVYDFHTCNLIYRYGNDEMNCKNKGLLYLEAGVVIQSKYCSDLPPQSLREDGVGGAVNASVHDLHSKLTQPFVLLSYPHTCTATSHAGSLGHPSHAYKRHHTNSDNTAPSSTLAYANHTITLILNPNPNPKS